MKYGWTLLAFVASLGTAVLAQHAGHGPQDAASRKPAAAPHKAPKASSAETSRTSTAFEGYRAYNPQEPAKGWRGANDEVREAGGHVGMAKGGHGAGHREDGKK